MSALFDKAKKQGETSKAKKSDNSIVVTIKESEHKGFSNKVERLNQLREETKALDAELKMINSDVSQVARKTYIDLYKQNKENVGMFVIMTEAGTKFKVTPADAYTSVNEDKFTELTEKYGEDICTQETEYSFNNKILEKHMDLISKLIMESDMPDEDKENLLVRKDKYSIKKGTINELANYGKKMESVFEDIQPTVQIKF